MFCDSYIVEFSYDTTCNYYEIGKYGCRNFHVTKLPLVMLRLLLFRSTSLHMLIFACLDNLFAYKMPMHRKYVRLRCVCHMFHDALFFSIIIFRVSIVEILCLASSVKRQRLLGGNPILFLFLAFCSCLVINNLSSLCFCCVFVFNQCLCQV